MTLRDKDFHKYSPCHTQQTVAANWPRDVLKRRVLEATHTEQLVAKTCHLVCVDLNHFAVPEQRRKTKGKKTYTSVDVRPQRNCLGFYIL